MSKPAVMERHEFLTPCSPQGLRVVQVTTDTDRDSEAIYLDCPSWTPDSRQFVLQRQASTDGTKKSGAWICDVEDGFRLRPLVEFDRPQGFDHTGFEGEASLACVLSPDGACAYHVRRRLAIVEILRVDLNTGRQDPQPVCTAPAPLRTRGAFTISADSERLLMGNWLGDGKREGAPWGAFVFHLRKGTHHVVEFGNGYRNMHCQYSHNPDPAFSHDLLLNATLPKFADGSWLTPPDGSWRWKDLPASSDTLGGAYTVVRDDGTNWRMVPLGRAPGFNVGGHNTWRGREYSVVSAVYDTGPDHWRSPLLEAAPLPATSEEERWLGQRHPNARWWDLTRNLARADSCHFGFDASGRHFVSDSDGYARAEYSFVYGGTYVTPPAGAPYVKTLYLLLPRTSWKTQPAHPHPYLSPDGKYVVFQSDFTGRPQVYVAYGFEWPEE
jgi:hypothetical protein